MVRARPELRSSFQFEGLEDRYPVKPVELRIAQQEDVRMMEEDMEYKRSVLQNKLADLSIKKAVRDMDMLEAQINREEAMLEQVPLARQEFGALDPRDPDYIKKRMEIVNKYPLAFEDESFVKSVDSPMLSRSSRIRAGRVESGLEVTEDQFNKSAMLLSDSQLIKRLGSKEPAIKKIAELQAEVARDTINQFMRQRGLGLVEPMQEDMAMEAEAPTTAEPTYNFSSTEEAEAYGLPPGTIIYINGRRAIVE